MEANQTKKCNKCGRELPIENFGLFRGSPRSWCKECMRQSAREYALKKKTTPVLNPALSEFTPQELITELRARHYEGELIYREVKVHKIKL